MSSLDARHPPQQAHCALTKDQRRVSTAAPAPMKEQRETGSD